ncbi:hypothetical protein [Nonomuraea sp. NPDC023979]|uniref:hypothetical protein n=1 Tax=Nonomuraea sp. NPDC023979 TaxID=3154796 RepID=UPI0033D3DAB9
MGTATGSRPARSFEIVWEKSNFGEIEYGYVGNIKAFSVTQETSRRFVLRPRLPDPKGVTWPPEEFSNRERAHDRANGILRDFLADFTARRPGSRRQASDTPPVEQAV